MAFCSTLTIHLLSVHLVITLSCGSLANNLSTKGLVIEHAGLAVVKYKRGEWDVVQDLFARAYDIQSTQLGPDHSELALTMSNSAGLLKAMSKLADAEIVYRTVRPTCYLFHSLPSMCYVKLSFLSSEADEKVLFAIGALATVQDYAALARLSVMLGLTPCTFLHFHFQ